MTSLLKIMLVLHIISGFLSLACGLFSMLNKKGARQHRLTLEGGREATFPYRYLGADPAAGPNYTGQPAVGSHYGRRD